jgi:hypothetical protein
MQRSRSWLGAACLSVLVACGGGGGDPGAPGGGSPPGETVTVAVTVVDTLGRFVSGATVAAGSANASTDATGQASLPVATGGERVIAVSKAGFAEQFKVLTLPSGNTATVPLQAMLIARAAAQTISTIEAGGTASGVQGVKVTFPAGALVNAAGQAVSGTIQMSMTPVDVSEIDVGAFPGLFEGIPTGATRQPIVSVGTSELVPEQGGQKLNLAVGKTADIELPLFVNRNQDGSLIVAGNTIPLWSLDTATGLWKQEGSGSVVLSAGSPTGLALRATISHFSWWNGDYPAQQGTVNLTVTVSGATLPANSSANVSGSVVAGTGPSSTATGTVVVGSTGQFKVPAASTSTRLTAQILTGSQTCRGSVDVSPAAGSTVSATIAMSCVTLDVRLVQPASDVSTNSQSPLPFRIEVDGSAPDSVELFADDTRIAQFSAQFFYSGFWDSSTFAEGRYTLQPRATKSGVVRDGGTISVVVDRTAPRATVFAPVTTVEVDRNTVFTVDFNETVLAAPFTLSDAIRLTVTQPGLAPVIVPFTVSQNTTGTRITVVPAAALPIGIASLSWGGVHDAAGNAVTGTVAASWNVSRTTQIGSDFEFENKGSTSLAFAVDASGTIHAVRQRPDTHNVEVLRFDGSDFVALGPQVNERAFGPELAIAIGGSGLVHVALEQINAAGTEGEVIVRRYDAVANVWQTLGPPLPTGRVLSQSAHPRLAIDAANRPVLSFTGGGGVFTLQARRFDGTAWALLGSVGDFVFDGHALVLNATGNPLIAYLQGAASSNGASLRVVEFDGTAFVSLGQLDTVGNATDSIAVPQIALAPDGRPSVAWSKSSLQAVSVASFDGTAFVPIPIVPALPTFNRHSGLGFLNGDLVVAGARPGGGVDVRRFHNGAWEPPATFATATAGDLTLIADGNTMLICETTFASGQAFGKVTRMAFP